MYYLLQLLSTFNKLYEDGARRDHYNTTSQAYKLYDVMWALALALNRTDAMIKGGADINGTGCEDVPGSVVPLELFNYSNKKLGCLIQWNIQRTNFSGLTVSHTCTILFCMISWLMKKKISLASKHNLVSSRALTANFIGKCKIISK